MNSTEHYMRTLAAHLRAPALNPPPIAINSKRLQVYVDLLFNNVDDVLSRAFPVTHSLLTANQWQTLIRQFYSEHACQTPYFREMAGEFIQWLSEHFTATGLNSAYPFLLELMHYEWVEIPLLMDQTEFDWESFNTEGDWLEAVWVFNPVMLLQSYQYPVHTISAKNLPTEPHPTHLLLVRNRQHKIDFLELNAVTAHLVELLMHKNTTKAAIAEISQKIHYIDHVQLLQFGLQLLAQFRSQDIVLGMTSP